MTDINSVEFRSASSRIRDEGNSSFMLNQSNVPMDIDIDDEIITSSSPTKFNRHRSSSSDTNEYENNNEQDKEDVFHQG